MTAAYQFDLTTTDDETQTFILEFGMTDGTTFPWSDYTFAYNVTPDPGPMMPCDDEDFGFSRTYSTLSLTTGSGITTDAVNSRITFTYPTALAPGRYRHFCLATHTNGTKIEVFDGIVSVSEGGF